MFKKNKTSDPLLTTSSATRHSESHLKASKGAASSASSSQETCPEPLSIIAENVLIEGIIQGKGKLVIDGGVLGSVYIDRLIVGEQAYIEGSVRCDYLEVRGRIIGNIEAKTVKLCETAFVEGNITHDRLSMEAGAYFQGHCHSLQPGLSSRAKSEDPLNPEDRSITVLTPLLG